MKIYKNLNENLVLMEIQIWNNKNSNGMFYYNNNFAKFKKVYFTFGKSKKDCFLIKTKDNNIETIDEHKNFNENEGKEILFRIRKSLKNNNIYEVINPIFDQKIFESDYNNFLNDKIWFSVKSQEYLCGNILNYNLNENDIIKLGKKKYIIVKKHFAFNERKENNIDENFYKNNNISYVSIINKKSKSIFNIDIKSNKYKIKKNKNLNTGKVNVKEMKIVNELNKQKSKNINQNINETYKYTNYNNLNSKYPININDNKVSTYSISQKSYKYENNNCQDSLYFLSTKEYTSKMQNRIGNEIENQIESDSDSESDNEYDKCWLCLVSNSDENNPLICLCNCHNFIHFECLKRYLTSKITVTENLRRSVTTYTCLKFNCDICLKPFQLRFRIPEFNKTYELIDLNLPEETDYICLESLDYINNNNNIKIVHIVKLREEDILIGRASYNDIIDEDTSVSRNHTVLKYNKYNKSLFLENRNGKYGTLVLVRGNIKIREEKTYFQILNAHISMELTNKNNFDKIGKESFQYNIIYDNNDNDNDDQW